MDSVKEIRMKYFEFIKKTLRGVFMKTSKRTIVLMTVELSEIDLDIAIDNYPKVERQILDYIQFKGCVIPEEKDVYISMTVELRVDSRVVDRAELSKEAEVELFIKSEPQEPEIKEPPPPDTETKDQIMDPGAMIENLAKDYKPSLDEEED